MFQGFPEETIRFFLGLRFHNDAAYFEAHRNEYEQYVREPFYAFIDAMAPAVKQIADDMELRPARCLARIRRDTRFTKDKSPYRDHMWLLFRRGGEERENATMTRFDQLLTGKRITNVIGYASFLTAFADYLAYGNGKQGRYALRSVLTISEHLPAQAREKLTTYLHCPVNSQYSNEENGVMAVQTGGEEYYVDSSGWHMTVTRSEISNISSIR